MKIESLTYLTLYAGISILSFFRYNKYAFSFVIFVLFVFVAFRFEVSADWPNYIDILALADGVPLGVALRQTDPGYAILNWFGANWFGGIYFVNAVCALLAIGGLAYFCSRMREPVLALSIAFPYLIVIAYLGATRQSVAIGFALVAIVAALDQKYVRFVCFVALATFFHKTAILLMIFAPFAGISGIGKRRAVLWSILPVFVAFYSLWDVLPHLIDLYIYRGGAIPVDVPSGVPDSMLGVPESLGEVRVHSSGAVMRLLMAATAAFIFVFLAWNRLYPKVNIRIWGVAAGAVGALFVLSFFFSTIADRAGLYFVALQLFVFSEMPQVVRPNYRNLVRFIIVIVYGISLYVWLNYGQHSNAWLPYKSVLAYF